MTSSMHGHPPDAPHPAEASSSAVQTYTPPALGTVAPSMANESASAMLGARARAEVESRIIMARMRPRNLNVFREKLIDACKRTRFADAARYSKPLGRDRDGNEKFAEGFSIRFAEECARHLGNIDVVAQMVSDSPALREIEVAVIDLETLSRWATVVPIDKTVERRSPRKGDEIVSSRVNSQGATVYRIRATDDDALLVKQAALISKAQREMIIKHIPSDIQEEMEEVILATLQKEEATDPTAARKRVLDIFYLRGVGAGDLEAYVGHSIPPLSSAELDVLRRIAAGLKQGEITWAELREQGFAKVSAEKPAGAAEGVAAAAEPVAEVKPASGAAALKDALKK